jgi:hypothetical protein
MGHAIAACARTRAHRGGFIAEGGGETWRRDFGGARMVSRYRERHGQLRERSAW